MRATCQKCRREVRPTPEEVRAELRNPGEGWVLQPGPMSTASEAVAVLDRRGYVCVECRKDQEVGP